MLKLCVDRHIAAPGMTTWSLGYMWLTTWSPALMLQYIWKGSDIYYDNHSWFNSNWGKHPLDTWPRYTRNTDVSDIPLWLQGLIVRKCWIDYIQLYPGSSRDDYLQIHVSILKIGAKHRNHSTSNTCKKSNHHHVWSCIFYVLSIFAMSENWTNKSD